MTDFVTLKDLSIELGLDKSNLRKYILANIPGIDFVKVRTPETRGQLTLALSIEDAEVVRGYRREDGFSANKKIAITDNGKGYFYIIQVIPEFEPNRVKLGFTGNIDSRLQAHRTSAPTACLVEYWPCKRIWEDTAMASLTRTGCELITNEIFACDNLDALVERGHSFFELLPPPNFKVGRATLDMAGHD